MKRRREMGRVGVGTNGASRSWHLSHASPPSHRPSLPPHRRCQAILADSIRVELAGVLTGGRSWRGERHAHGFWEAILVLKGHGYCERGGVRIHFNNGDLVWLPPGQPHTFGNAGRGGVELAYIGFSVWPEPILRDGLPLNLGEYPSARGAVKAFLALTKSFHQADAGLLTLDNRSAVEAAVSLTNVLFQPAASEGFPGREDMIAEKAKAVIAANVERPIGLSDIASEFYLSPHYVADMFKRSTGVTIKEYHEHLRMQRAEKWLANPAMRVKEVSDRLGYASLEYFSARFRKTHGMSPRSFRCRLHPVRNRPEPPGHRSS